MNSENTNAPPTEGDNNELFDEGKVENQSLRTAHVKLKNFLYSTSPNANKEFACWSDLVLEMVGTVLELLIAYKPGTFKPLLVFIATSL